MSFSAIQVACAIKIVESLRERLLGLNGTKVFAPISKLSSNVLSLNFYKEHIIFALLRFFTTLYFPGKITAEILATLSG